MTYGKSNEKTSWLYDPLYTLKTTISGQILISMWAERLVEASPDLTILQINTDGITVLINESDYDKCLKASDKLMSETGMEYEKADYNQMIITDVNNYIAEYVEGYCKYKGLYEIDKQMHKDPSMRIVPIALSNYFIKGIPIEKTIKEHNNIYDFTLRFRVNREWDAKMDSLTEDTRIKTEELSRNTRYYISSKGGVLYKQRKSNNKTSGQNVGFLVTIFNKYIKKPFLEYNINYDFYSRECRKIIDPIESKQLSLWG